MAEKRHNPQVAGLGFAILFLLGTVVSVASARERQSPWLEPQKAAHSASRRECDGYADCHMTWCSLEDQGHYFDIGGDAESGNGNSDSYLADGEFCSVGDCPPCGATLVASLGGYSGLVALIAEDDPHRIAELATRDDAQFSPERHALFFIGCGRQVSVHIPLSARAEKAVAVVWAARSSNASR